MVRIPQHGCSAPHWRTIALLAMCQPTAAHAHGQEALGALFLLLAAPHLIPLADLLRRGVWARALLYCAAWPVLAMLAYLLGSALGAALGGLAPLLGLQSRDASAVSLIAMLTLFLIQPFVLWWWLLKRWDRWGNAKPQRPSDADSNSPKHR